jgi:biotin transport system substrate-specific component
MQGCLGMPVLAGGAWGIIHFAGPTGGYLIGFVLQAYFTGLLFEKTGLPLFVKLLIPSILLLTIGTLWLANFTGMSAAWILGFYPFIPGDLIKIGMTASYLKFHEKHFNLSR